MATNRPGEAGQQSASSPPDEVAPQEENTARSPTEDVFVPNMMTPNVAGVTTFSSISSRGIELIAPSDAPRPKAAGQAGNSTFAVWVQPIVPPALADQSGDALQVRQFLPPRQKENDEDHQEHPSKAAGDAKATAMKKITAGQETASAQAVNRGHSVTLIEVPDEDNDTAYQIWLAKERLPIVAKKEATSDEPAQSSTTPVITRGWCKPFKLHKGGETAREQLYELCEPPRYLWWRQNNDRDFMLDVQLTPCTGRQILMTKGLLDSSCTSSSINRTFIQRHGLDMKKTAIPIAVYNANSTRNKAGNITEFVEFQMTIGNHSERIGFMVTDLSSKDLYLGHDWLKCHNLVINWNMGMIIFRCCQCVKNPFPLPDADPDDQWDEELEDGYTILAVNMEEELVIHAVHHANDLTATANVEKPKKTFEEMVPPDYCSFHDLFSKENFDELLERKSWDHAIKLIPNAKSTLDCKVYPLNRDKQDQLNKFLDENLELGCIRESKSPFASPFFFIKKKNGSLRPVQDYRKLNEMTIKNRYPLPLISELIDKLQGAKYFMKLDIRWGYNNIRIKEGDEEKAAF
ncbi:uncharacterized protein ARMOST_03168 [Armillaria ostoyae]|uniref:Reverse transcriptase domain-containing protein n=1 Tax=Armillaria ostoyae TaxID=47428 RepID=A0A284QTT1_ARMOS|nr:uncharacterized protein ARMOST_03168 [Armillaria ostoyae]